MLLGGMALYLIGWKNIKSMVFGQSDEKVAQEAATRNKLEKRTILSREYLQDSQGTINNRIKEMEKDLQKMKVTISIEKDTISLDAKNREKLIIPDYVKQMNKRMSSVDPKLKVFKAEEKIKNRTVSLREHYENWHGIAGGDPSIRFEEVDLNSLTPE